MLQCINQGFDYCAAWFYRNAVMWKKCLSHSLFVVFMLVRSVNIFLCEGRFLNSALFLTNVVGNVTSYNISLMPHKSVYDVVKIPHVM